MMTMIEKKRTSPLCRILSSLTAVSFLFTSVLPIPSYAQVAAPYISTLPAPGTMITPTQAFTPPLMVGVTIHPENPLMFDFIVDKGDKDISDEELKKISNTMIKYFLATITIPENELWVNLSPYEEGQIIPQSFGETEMGRDFLTQDYLLKQLAASLTYPENELGKKFWDRVYQRVEKEYGITDIPLNTFNKVWIVPDDAAVYQDGPTAVVLNSHLKVMLEEDYLALNHNLKNEKYGTDQLQQNDVEKINQVTSQIVREVLIPEIEKEINQGETFANLRQMYSAMILATWYKKNLRDSLLGQVYMDQNKTAGVEVEDKEVKQKIYDQYLESLKKGVYDYIKEDVDAVTKTPIPRQYFSGGMHGPQAVKQFLRERFKTYPKGIQDRIKVLHAGKPANQRVTLRTVLYEFKESNQLTAEDYEKVLAGIADISEDDAKGILSDMTEPNAQSENAGKVKPMDRGMFTSAIEELAGNGFDLEKAREALSKTGQYNGDQIQEAVIFFKEHIDLRKQYPDMDTEGILTLQNIGMIEKKLGDQLYYYTNGMEFASTKVNNRMAYFPLNAGPGSMMSAITPRLGGDAKTHVDEYLFKMTSREDLREIVRNFWVSVNGEAYSFTNESEGSKGYFEAGPFWKKVVRVHPKAGIQLEATIFVPKGTKAEVMRVKVINLNKKEQTIVPTAAIPIFARSQGRRPDHEHVSSLINVIVPLEDGVMVTPPVAFNERKGHLQIDTAYYVRGYSHDGAPLQGTFPTVNSFLGDESGLENPAAVMKNWQPTVLKPEELNGVEAMGGLRFAQKTLASGTEAEYVIVAGLEENKEKAQETFAKLDQIEKVDRAFEDLKAYWQEKAGEIKWGTGDEQMNTWLSWVETQPKLRCEFGCSFLPDHDYGKGGKGWRDLFQDLLAIILTEPEQVRERLVTYLGGVRVDGTNATIITSKEEGWFKGDRNGISRVWMDHGVWPWFTLKLYIDQTGDYSILTEVNSYFKDAQMSRAADPQRVDRTWTEAQGYVQKAKNGQVYQGSMIEHVLIQTLVQFFNVGEHNNIRLEGADWNDAMDKAPERGESVGFSAFYAGNMMSLADTLEKSGIKKIKIANEMLALLDRTGPVAMPYDHANNSVEMKRKRLELYFQSVEPALSGEQLEIDTDLVIHDLRAKAEWIFDHIQRQEMVEVVDQGETYRFVRGYYDNNGIPVEGKKEVIDVVENGTTRRYLKDYYEQGILIEGKEDIWVTLTPEVFAIMMGAVTHKDMEDIIKSVDHFLKHRTLGGYQLNTDRTKGNLQLKRYATTQIGRGDAFAPGTKENGALFSHMDVMYDNGLYEQGFVRKGYEVMHSIYRLHQNTANSRVYPGIAEYLDWQGRGYYHYLTGSASWLILTMLTQVFGVRGEGGDLVLEPKLVREQFRKDGTADVETKFADHDIKVVYKNPGLLDYGEYRIGEIKINGQAMRGVNDDTKVKLIRSSFEHLSQDEKVFIEVMLAPKPGVTAKPALVSQDPPVQNLTENLSELVEKQVAGYLGMADRLKEKPVAPNRPGMEQLEETPTAAQTAEPAKTQAPDQTGGIDFNAKLLNLQIKRDGQGVPLPIHQQPIQTMQIDGFIPVIINIIPTTNLPLLLGSEDSNDSKDVSYHSSDTKGIKPEAYLENQEEAPVLN